MSASTPNEQLSLIQRLRLRATIRRSISTRKSVQENKPDRISDLLEEAADEIERLQKPKNPWDFPYIKKEESIWDGLSEWGTRQLENGE